MFVDLQGAGEWFERYVRSFDLSEPMIRMKYLHSLDVRRVGEKLVSELGWPRAEADAGIAACLLHDTGRFSQYRDFGTYYDGASVDHGDRGYKVLEENFPAPDSDGCTADERARGALLQAVKWHNKKSLPELEPSVMPFCRLARDADKLDVFQLVRRRMDEGTVGALLPRHKIDAPLSEALLDEVEQDWSGSYKHASSLLDFLLIQLTWTLDLNYAPSLAVLEESKVLDRIRDCFPRGDARVRSVLDGIFDRIEQHKRAV